MEEDISNYSQTVMFRGTPVSNLAAGILNDKSAFVPVIDIFEK